MNTVPPEKCDHVIAQQTPSHLTSQHEVEAKQLTGIRLQAGVCVATIIT